MNSTHGLREQIANATTSDEINKLLSLGKTFEQVDYRTRSRWNNTAKRRLTEIATGVQKKEVKTEAKPVKAKKQKKVVFTKKKK
jgi:hypothetical protein